MNEITIGLVQMVSRCDNLSTNLQKIEGFVRQAAAQGVAIVCFPELSLTGYCLGQDWQAQAKETAEAVQALQVLARELKLVLMAGLAETGSDNKTYITQLICQEDGTADFYRKTHLGQKEKLHFTAGDRLPVFTLKNGLKVGIELCYDTHFPEVTTKLSQMGAQIVFAPHAVPCVSTGSRKEIWSKYIPARAYDNRVYFACCNQLGDNGHGSKFAGGCLAYGPDGNLIAEDFSGQEGLLTVRLSLAELELYRQAGKGSMGKRFFPQDRRPELY